MQDDNKNSGSFDLNSDTENDARLNLLYEIGGILSSLETMNAAAPQILEAICRNLRFDLGELWCLGKDSAVLRLESVWHDSSSALENFVAQSRQFEFSSGEGLPGKSWAKKAPVWVAKLSGEENLPRDFFAEGVNLRSGFAFPILLGEKFLGAFSFFSRDARQPEKSLLQMFSSVGNQIGQFIRRERVETHLRESEESYRIVTETASDAIIKIDENSTILFVNTSVERIFGYTVEEMLGKPLTMIMPGDLREKHRAGFSRYLETGKRHLSWAGIEVSARHADGHLFPLEISFGEYHQTGKRFFIGIARDISRRRAGAEKLRKSEASFRQLSEAVPQIVWVTEADGSLSYVNEQWIEFSGFSLEESNNPQIMAEVFHPDDVEPLARAWKKSFAGGEDLEIEMRMRNRSGAYRWFLTRSRPAKDENGRVFKWFGTSTDITETKEAESRLALLAEISESMRTFEDPDELLFTVSKAVGEHLQVRRCLFNEIDLANDRETVHRDYCRGVSSVAGVHKISDYSSVTSAEMIAGKTVVNNDSQTDPRTASDYAKIYELNGERAYIAVPLLRENRWVASLWVSDDRPRRWSRQEISLLETIAERTWTAIEKLRINRALRQSEERLQLAIDISRISTFDIDLMTDAVQTDEVGRAIYGFAADEPLTFSKIQSHFHPDDRDEVARRVASAFAPDGADDFEVEQRIIRTDGEIRWIRVRGRAFFEGEGSSRRAFYCLGTYIDITNSKQAEAERERLLANEQEAREAAEQANTAKDEFIALVSHELRSPLNAMLGWTRILQDQKPDAQMTQYALDVIVKNARSQSRLIEDLLDIARLGRGRLHLELQPTELIPIINTAVETIKPTVEANDINLSLTLERAADFITGDSDRLRQVIENLLSNALKFTPKGGSIEIRLERENSHAKIVVSDTGQGISREFLPQIFERFKQADASTTRRYGGLGIGLSLARDLVELHGGVISAESEGEGKGATFTVTLPLRVVSPMTENSSKVEFMDSQGKLSGFWILAVDDEADARELVSFMLQINGAKVTTANSAVEALDILKSSNGRLPDILLSDISMPNESGYALLEKIRALPPEHGGQIPAVALTAFSRPEDREAAFEAGFQKHLGKPVEPADLISAILETAGAK